MGPTQSINQSLNQPVNLCVCVCVDLLVGLVSVTTDLAWRVTVDWYAGNALCKIIRYAQVDNMPLVVGEFT